MGDIIKRRWSRYLLTLQLLYTIGLMAWVGLVIFGTITDTGTTQYNPIIFYTTGVGGVYIVGVIITIFGKL